MSEVQLLFVVLAGLYLWECACWVRRGTVAFATWWGRCWRARHPGVISGNQRGGFILATPWPPLGTFLTARAIPLSLSPAGVLAYVATNVNPGWRPAQTGHFLSFESLHQARARGKKLELNGQVWSAFATSDSAQAWAEFLTQLQKLPVTQRESKIAGFIGESFDEKKIKARWQEFQLSARRVRVLTNLLFLYLFVTAPALIWRVGLSSSWQGLLLGLAVLTIGTAIVFHRAHKTLYSQAEDERFTYTLTIALAPTSAVRAMDTLSRPLFERFHPLAVAHQFLPADQLREFARYILRDTRHPALPLCPSADPHICAVEAHSRLALLNAVEQFLQRTGHHPDQFCQPPPRDESCCAYCPRCLAQFTSIDAGCSDCGGRKLVAFS